MSQSQLVKSLLASLDWFSFRNPPAVTDYELTAQAVVWLQGIPQHSRPLLLSRKFPRIANRLEQTWNKPEQLWAYFDELLQDKRGNRQGFSRGVAEELRTLQTYAQTVIRRQGAKKLHAARQR